MDGLIWAYVELYFGPGIAYWARADYDEAHAPEGQLGAALMVIPLDPQAGRDMGKALWQLFGGTNETPPSVRPKRLPVPVVIAELPEEYQYVLKVREARREEGTLEKPYLNEAQIIRLAELDADFEKMPA